MSRDLSWILPGACAIAALLALLPRAQAQDDSFSSPSAAPPPQRLPSASATPRALLPPGASFPDPGPSKIIYPLQQIPLYFSHKKHTTKEGLGLQCIECHSAATTSTATGDQLLPKPQVCDRCHESNHSDLLDVKQGSKGFGECKTCHIGYDESKKNEVARLIVPTARLRSNHKIHTDRNIGCESCHGAVQELDLATREQLPRMKGCFGCHGMSGPNQGNAKSDCVVCHEPLPDGRIISAYPDGKLLPPRWLGNLEHTADFIERHKSAAANNSRACSTCHTETFCTDCHDGRIRPRSIHPNDYLSLHPTEARLESSRCSSCHQEQQFCQPCHTRSGVTMTSSPGSIRDRGRFHPPRATWSELPRTRQHHAWEAMRNLNACVSCHTERDCTICHATQAAGGRGFNPHPPDFQARCKVAVRKNPRPCLVCHEGSSPRNLCP